MALSPVKAVVNRPLLRMSILTNLSGVILPIRRLFPFNESENAYFSPTGSNQPGEQEIRRLRFVTFSHTLILRK